MKNTPEARYQIRFQVGNYIDLSNNKAHALRCFNAAPDAVELWDAKEFETVAAYGFGFQIFVHPSNQRFKPHIHKESGVIGDRSRAFAIAESLRQTPDIHDKRRKFYKRVEVVEC